MTDETLDFTLDFLMSEADEWPSMHPRGLAFRRCENEIRALRSERDELRAERDKLLKESGEMRATIRRLIGAITSNSTSS